MTAELFSDPSRMTRPWGLPATTTQSALASGDPPMTPEHKAAAVGRIRVNHPRFKAAADFVDGVFERSGCLEDPGGGRIVAASGMGKTTIRNRMLERHPTAELPDRLHMPVMAINCSTGNRIGAYIDLMLAQCSFAFANAKHTHGLTRDGLPARMRTLIDALRTCRVRMIIFDEFQHLGEQKMGVLSKEVTDGLKTLYNETQVSMIFLGEAHADRPFEQNDQFRSRFPGRVAIPLFAFDTDFIGVLNSFDKQLPFAVQSGLAEQNVARAMFDATEGRMRSVVKILTVAVRYAAANQQNRLSLKSLSAAHQDVFGGDPRKKDPFRRIA